MNLSLLHYQSVYYKIFEIQLINGALFLNAKCLFFLLLLFVPVTVIVPLTTIYTSLKSHKSDLSIGVLNFICLLCFYLSSTLPDWSWTSIHFLEINLDTSSGFAPNKFVIFCYSIFNWCQNNLKSLIICCLFSSGM